MQIRHHRRNIFVLISESDFKERFTHRQVTRPDKYVNQTKTIYFSLIGIDCIYLKIYQHSAHEFYASNVNSRI